MEGDREKRVFGTSHEWTQRMVSKVAYNYTDVTPIDAMVQDEFLLWVKQDAPSQNVHDFLKAVAAKPAGDLQIGDGQSNDTDRTLTRMLYQEEKRQYTYQPIKSRATAAGQTAGRHI